MRTDDDLKLLDAVLADEDWAACSAHIQGAGIASLRAARNRRKRVRAALQMSVFAVFAAISAWFVKGHFENSRLGTDPSASSSSPNFVTANTLSSGGKSRDTDGVPQLASASNQSAECKYITEDQMLSMLPKGSCLIAEVNGEKQLVFLDSP